MNKVIKRVNVIDAKLYVTSAGQRHQMAEFKGEVVVNEQTSSVSILGNRCQGEKKIIASFMIADDIDYLIDDSIHSGKVFDAVGTVQGTSINEVITFAGLHYADMNPIEGTITFEITDIELIKKLLSI